MFDYHASYRKTTLIAAIVGTLCMFVCLWVFLRQEIALPGAGLSVSIPFPVAMGGAFLCVVVALLCYAVMIGGLLALRYDAKGRARFD